MSKLILGYWGIAGLAQPIRYLLAYSRLSWQDRIYTDRNIWFQKDKQTLGLKYPNIPYLIDDQVKITQSEAILRYIPNRIHKPRLLGKSLADETQVNTLLGVIRDLSSPIFPLAYNPNYESERNKVFQQKIRPKLSLIQQNIINQYYLGYLTIVDFRLTVLADSLAVVFPEQFPLFPKINKVKSTIHNIPEVKNYRINGVTRLFPEQAHIKA